jgi:hypothetical protein
LGLTKEKNCYFSNYTAFFLDLPAFLFQ